MIVIKFLILYINLYPKLYILSIKHERILASETGYEQNPKHQRGVVVKLQHHGRVGPKNKMRIRFNKLIN